MEMVCQQSKGGLRVAAVILCISMTACSERAVEPSSNLISSAADVHSDQAVLQETAEIDALLTGPEAGALGGQTSLFDATTELLVRDPELDFSSTKTNDSYRERNAYFGDLHVHTTYSFDGHAFGTLATPYDAYRFARGEAIKNPAGYDMQLTRPMDFYAVTDHGEFLGLVKAAADTTTSFSKKPFSEPYHNLNAPDNFGTDLFSRTKRLVTFGGFIPNLIQGITEGEINRQEVLDITRSAWQDIIAAADEYNDPGRFTTFAGYEYTTSTAKMGNLHRNVIFQNTDRLPVEPFSRFHSSNPEDLWDWMDELRSLGVESIAIPHNSNGSNGQMFKLTDVAGNPFDDAYIAQRTRNEPIVEMTQIKGTSETHPMLSSTDEWAGFEIAPYRVATAALSAVNGSFVREALLNGMVLEQQGTGNPYQFGFIGSSDTHSAASQNDESNFVSKLGILSSTAFQRGSIPETGLVGQFTYYSSKLFTSLRPTPLGKNMYVKINGEVYTGGGVPTFGASGLAAAWAEDNTRDSLYSAFRRKEVFATSGPRIRLRFFAGYDFDQTMLTAVDGIQRAYASGVSMGGTLLAKTNKPADESPRFLIMASADPDNAPLQRLQVIKGWIDANGDPQEQVFDVACANGGAIDEATHRCPDNGARVDISTCAINPETGSAQLAALWRDPGFKGDQRAFYYARVLENPTCRWSTWDALRAGVAPRADLATTLQERAWSSPIHYQND